jgi:hypothetical protein
MYDRQLIMLICLVNVILPILKVLLISSFCRPMFIINIFILYYLFYINIIMIEMYYTLLNKLLFTYKI